MWSIVHCFVTPRHLIHLVQLTDHTPGGLPYKCDGDARRLISGCKLQIWSHLGYRLVLCIKKFTKKNALCLTTQKSLLGVSLSLSHTHIGPPWGFNLNFPTSIPVTFI